MKPVTINNAKRGTKNKILGGYIQNIWYNEEKGYLTFGLKVEDVDRSYYVNIMVFEYTDPETHLHLNPNYGLIEDAYEKGVPISCVYLQQERCNKLIGMYVNFSANQYADPLDDLPF